MEQSKLTREEALPLLCRGRIAFSVAHNSTHVPSCPVCTGSLDLSDSLGKRYPTQQATPVAPKPAKSQRRETTRPKRSKKVVAPMPETKFRMPKLKIGREKTLQLIYNLAYSRKVFERQGASPEVEYFYPQGKVPPRVIRALSDVKELTVGPDTYAFIRSFLLYHEQISDDLKDLAERRLAAELKTQSSFATVEEQSAPKPYIPRGVNFHERVPEHVGRLQGSLVKKFLKAKYRGYLGSPSHWLRNSRTARETPGWSKSLSLWRMNPLLSWQCLDSAARGDQPQVDAAKRSHFSVHVRGYSKSNHTDNVALSKRLARSSWPKQRYPSSPTLIEWERRRVQGQPLETSRWSCPGGTRVSPKQLLQNGALLVKVVRNLVIGIRSDEVVPRKFLRYFGYRWNFLILTTPLPPLPLCRFLVGVWMRRRTSVWLKYDTSFRNILKELPSHWLAGTSQ